MRITTLQGVVGSLMLSAPLLILFYSFRPNWGFYAHKKINQLAVFTLPPELFGFYKDHIEYVTLHAVDPDKRRYAFKGEAVRHYIDLDIYKGNIPPYQWDKALSENLRILYLDGRDTVYFPIIKDTEGRGIVTDVDTLCIADPEWRSFLYDFVIPFWENFPMEIPADILEKLLPGLDINEGSFWIAEPISMHGILPWHLQRIYRQLVFQYKCGDPGGILKTASDIGHYIGDAHVPLHTTVNYNGQLTGQYGIHGFWESRIPELFAESEYDLFTEGARYIEKKDSFFWGIVLQSHSLVDSVLSAEKEVSERFPESSQYCLERRGATVVRVPCMAYTRAFSEAMGDMVEMRMRSAIHAIGSVWYSAWVDAGKPELPETQFNQADTMNVIRYSPQDNPMGRPH